MLHAAMLKIISAIVAKSRTDFYSVQCCMQLVSQRFWPLQDMLNGAMTRATCLATPQVAWKIAPCNRALISDLLEQIVASLLASSTLLQDDNNLFQTCQQQGTSNANTSCWQGVRFLRVRMITSEQDEMKTIPLLGPGGDRYGITEK
jgi:hypothetical protein